MTDIHIKSTHYTEDFPVKPLTINPLTVNPLTIANVQSIAPVGVHVKELNQIAPLFVESLRVDHVRHIDPLRIDRLNITQLPGVNVSVGQMPPLDLNVRRLPPVAISLQQELELKSCYTMRARLLGLEVMRMQIEGQTRVAPRDCARREQSRSHERSFPEVAAAGNPAIPVRAVEKLRWTKERCAPSPPPPAARRHAVSAGAPLFSYSMRQAAKGAAAGRGAAENTVSFGG
jgi:hypothetical protein